MTGGGPAHATELLVTHIYNMGFGADAIRLRRGAHRGAILRFWSSSPAWRIALSAATRARWRATDAKARASPSIHLVMVVVCFLMLIPFYWVAKTAVTGENIYAYPPRILPLAPHLYNFVDVWYCIPFARYFAEQRRSCR